MGDIHLGLYAGHQRGTFQVEAPRIVVFHCVNSGPVDGERWWTSIAFATHFAEGRKLLKFATKESDIG
jgi:hypothetical protein